MNLNPELFVIEPAFQFKTEVHNNWLSFFSLDKSIAISLVDKGKDNMDKAAIPVYLICGRFHGPANPIAKKLTGYGHIANLSFMEKIQFQKKKSPRGGCGFVI